jgi:hypothetical protein
VSRRTVLVLVILAMTMEVSRGQQTRDRAAVEPAGTSRIAGVVVSDESPDRPISRAIVTLTGGGLALARAAVTGIEGAFSFDNLPAGDFTIRATKPAYLPGAYGARRPWRTGTQLTIAQGQSADVRLRLARGAVIAGTIRDARGNVATGVTVEVVPVPRVRLPVQQNVVSQSAVTDDQGAYRVFGLPPGDYLIAAIPPRPGFSSVAGLPGMEMRSMGPNNLTQRSASEIDAIFRELQSGAPSMAAPGSQRPSPPVEPVRTIGYAPVYFPNVVVVGQATKVSLRQAEIREGIDVTIDLVKTTTVTGLVTNPHGALPAVALSIQAADERPYGAPIAAPALTQAPSTDGKFEYTGLTPGRYVIWARSRDGAPAPPPGAGTGGGATILSGSASAAGPGAQLWAMAEIVAAGEPISGVTLTLQPTLRLTGRVRFDSAATGTPGEGSTVRVTLASETAPFGGMANLTNFGGPPIPAALAQPDGTFALTGIVPGVYRLTATLSAPAWSLQSAVLGDRDVLDYPLEIGAAGESRPIVLTFSDRQTEIAGSLRAPAGIPAPDHFVLVFPADRSLWRPLSRRVQVARPSTSGQFTIRGLPPGEYLIGALTDMEAEDVHDAAFLEQVAAAAIRISLKDGEQKRQDIQIAK